jgi:hypothetical protein
MLKRIMGICFFMLMCGSLPAESLWDDTFPGYIAGTSALAVGDIVVVEIDASMNLRFDSSSKDSKTITLEFSGGEYGDLFSFLPRALARGDRSIQGRENYSLKTELVTRVTQIDANGNAFIQGTRTIQFGGKGDSITISGWVNPDDLDQQRKISYSKVADVRLAFRSFLQPQGAVLTDQDIQRIITGTAATPTTPGTTPTTPTTPGTTPTTPGTTGTADQTGKISLTEAKKRELVLLYINRIVDILFR